MIRNSEWLKCEESNREKKKDIRLPYTNRKKIDETIQKLRLLNDCGPAKDDQVEKNNYETDMVKFRFVGIQPCN